MCFLFIMFIYFHYPECILSGIFSSVYLFSYLFNLVFVLKTGSMIYFRQSRQLRTLVKVLSHILVH